MAEELARRKCQVVLVDRQIVLAGEVAAGIREQGGRATAVETDVGDFASIQRVILETFRRTGRIDYLFNNAGINILGNVTQYSIDDWRRIMETNLMGVVNGVQAVYSLMMSQGFGHIVNTASMAGLIPFPGLVAYSAAKHAVVGLSLALRAEAASLGIRVSVLCPGFVQTAILEDGGVYGGKLYDLSPEQERWTQGMIQRSKPVSPDFVARKALDQVARNKPVIVLPARNRCLWSIHRLFPGIQLAWGQRQYEKVDKLRFFFKSSIKRIPGHPMRESPGR